MSDNKPDASGVPTDFQTLRGRIEGIDRSLIQLLHERMEVADAIADAKLEKAVPIRDEPREERVLQRVRGLAVEAGLDAHGVEALYRAIMAMSVARQQEYIAQRPSAPLRVTFQGAEGAYSHLAAQRRYANRAGGAFITGCSTFREAATAVLDGRADLALLPIENTTAGSINQVYDLLADGGLTITAEVISRIEHCLIVVPGTKLEDLRTVISHPQALSQCEHFLNGLEKADAREVYDTAGAARMVRDKGDPTLAAIASASAAERYGLEILRAGIENHQGNSTRFVELAIEARPCAPDAVCKTSFLITLGHQPGALGQVLTNFASRNINLTKLESRPVPDSPWNYRFYVDALGHAQSKAMVEAIEATQGLVADLRVLGTYPAAKVG